MVTLFITLVTKSHEPRSNPPKFCREFQSLRSRGNLGLIWLLYGFCLKDSRIQGLIGFCLVYKLYKTLRTLFGVLGFRDPRWKGLGFARVGRGFKLYRV